MPGSVQEGKDLVKEFCLKHNVNTILDVGPGEGTYYYALQDIGITRLDGVEAWAPYINEYHLWDKYTNLYIADIYYFNWDKVPNYDMILLGDVIEHLPTYQGLEVIRKAIEKATYVVLSLPIYGYPQGWGHDGNWFEAHLEQYSNESVLNTLIVGYTLLEQMQGGTVGVYIFTNKDVK